VGIRHGNDVAGRVGYNSVIHNVTPFSVLFSGFSISYDIVSTFRKDVKEILRAASGVDFWENTLYNTER
jgi:hypothetical protein